MSREWRDFAWSVASLLPTNGCKLVLLRRCELAAAEGLSYLTKEQLAEATGQSVKNIERADGALIELGLMEPLVPQPETFQRVTVYRIVRVIPGQQSSQEEPVDARTADKDVGVQMDKLSVTAGGEQEILSRAVGHPVSPYIDNLNLTRRLHTPLSPEQTDAEFEEFWSQGPSNPTDSKTDARQAYLEVRRAGAPHADLCNAIRHYSQAVASQRRGYAMHRHRWLRKGRWKEFLEPRNPKASTNKLSEIIDLAPLQMLLGVSPSLLERWNDARRKLLLRVGPEVFKSWLSKLELIGAQERTFRFKAPTSWHREEIERRFGQLISEALRARIEIVSQGPANAVRQAKKHSDQSDWS